MPCKQSSHISNVTEQHWPIKSLILWLQPKFAYFQYFHFPKGKQILCLWRTKKTNYGQNNKTDPKVHVAQMGLSTKEGKKEGDHHFPQMHPSLACQSKLLEMITRTTANKPKINIKRKLLHGQALCLMCTICHQFLLYFWHFNGTLISGKNMKRVKALTSSQHC